MQWQTRRLNLWLMHFIKSSGLSRMLGFTSQLKTIFSCCGLRLLLLSLLSFGLCLHCSIGINATSTYYQNNNLTVTGTLTYIGSSNNTGSPVDNLADGREHTIYLNKEAERSLVKDPYLTNLSNNTVTGWIEDGYEVQIQYSQTLAVTQPHYTTNGSTRNGTAYYEVNVSDINTLLLYRSYNGSYIGYIICGGVFVIILSHLLKRVL